MYNDLYLENLDTEMLFLENDIFEETVDLIMSKISSENQISLLLEGIDRNNDGVSDNQINSKKQNMLTRVINTIVEKIKGIYTWLKENVFRITRYQKISGFIKDYEKENKIKFIAKYDKDPELLLKDATRAYNTVNKIFSGKKYETAEAIAELQFEMADFSKETNLNYGKSEDLLKRYGKIVEDYSKLILKLGNIRPSDSIKKREVEAMMCRILFRYFSAIQRMCVNLQPDNFIKKTGMSTSFYKFVDTIIDVSIRV